MALLSAILYLLTIIISLTVITNMALRQMNNFSRIYRESKDINRQPKIIIGETKRFTKSSNLKIAHTIESHNIALQSIPYRHNDKLTYLRAA